MCSVGLWEMSMHCTVRPVRHPAFLKWFRGLKDLKGLDEGEFCCRVCVSALIRGAMAAHLSAEWRKMFFVAAIRATCQELQELFTPLPPSYGPIGRHRTLWLTRLPLMVLLGHNVTVNFTTNSFTRQNVRNEQTAAWRRGKSRRFHLQVCVLAEK